MIPDNLKNFLKNNLVWLIIGLIFLISLSPKIFIPLIIILIIAFFNKPILNFIINKYSMDNQTIDYANIIGSKAKLITKIVIGLVVLIVVLIILVRLIIIVPAGTTGVYHLFGRVKDQPYRSGLHLVIPFAKIDLMSIRTEQYTMSIIPTEGQRPGDDSIDALTKEGLKVNLDITALYHLNEDKAPEVFRTIGLNYDEKILRPEVRGAIRDVIALYDAKDIYSEKREEATNKIAERLKESLNPRGVEVETVILRNVALPALLTQAIEAKLTADQEQQKYDFILQKETKEAERKRIEAAGQRDSQKIINESLSNQYLQYLYIKELQNRPGTIYVPYDLPLFKGIQ
ncbi:MAG: prohibitin family protein [Candidatus Parcubacteria bacterium]|nr:prohibitin family protein [Candidatus Parcubacteria bacterium]